MRMQLLHAHSTTVMCTRSGSPHNVLHSSSYLKNAVRQVKYTEDYRVTGIYKPSILKNTDHGLHNLGIHASQYTDLCIADQQLTLNISDGSSLPLLMSRFIEMNCSTVG